MSEGVTSLRSAALADGAPALCETAASSNSAGTLARSFDDTVSGLLPPLGYSAEQRARLYAEYTAGSPYPHLVKDGLFPEWVLRRIIEEFPSPRGRDWIQWDTASELKQTSRGLHGLRPFTQLFLLELCSEPFLGFMREITGHEDLVADPLFHGGGLHESLKGSYLNVHADYTYHPVLPLVRRVNLIIYLNEDWPADFGGDIELWDAMTMTRAVSVPPLFNRSLIFPTTNEALHGFPSPLTCPDDRSRKSISIFYWTANQEEFKKGASINFMPGLKTTEVKSFLRSCVPPIVYRELHHARTFARHRVRDLKRRRTTSH